MFIVIFMLCFSKEVGVIGLFVLFFVLGYVFIGLIFFVDNVIVGYYVMVIFVVVIIGMVLLWLLMLILIGMFILFIVLVLQLYGVGCECEIGLLFCQVLWLVLGLGLIMFIFFIVVLLLLLVFGIVLDIVLGVIVFLYVVCWGGFVLILYFCMCYLSEGMYWMLLIMLFGFGGLLVLVLMGYVLVNGKFGFLELGVEGLGIVLVVMMWLQVMVFVLYLWCIKCFVYLQLFLYFEGLCWKVIWELLCIGLLIGIIVLMEGGLFIVIVLLIGCLGVNEVVVYQIVINVVQLCFMILMGVVEVIIVCVGYVVGCGDGFGVWCVVWVGYVIIMGMQMLLVVVLLFGYDVIVGVYINDLVVVGLVLILLLYVVIFQFLDGIQVLLVGVLCGLKDICVLMFIVMFVYWGLGMLFGVGFGLGLGMGLQGMWIGLIVGLIVVVILMGWCLCCSSQCIGQFVLF